MAKTTVDSQNIKEGKHSVTTMEIINSQGKAAREEEKREGTIK